MISKKKKQTSSDIEFNLEQSIQIKNRAFKQLVLNTLIPTSLVVIGATIAIVRINKLNSMIDKLGSQASIILSENNKGFSSARKNEITINKAIEIIDSQKKEISDQNEKIINLQKLNENGSLNEVKISERILENLQRNGISELSLTPQINHSGFLPLNNDIRDQLSVITNFHYDELVNSMSALNEENNILSVSNFKLTEENLKYYNSFNGSERKFVSIQEYRNVSANNDSLLLQLKEVSKNMDDLFGKIEELKDENMELEAKLQSGNFYAGNTISSEEQKQILGKIVEPDDLERILLIKGTAAEMYFVIIGEDGNKGYELVYTWNNNGIRRLINKIESGKNRSRIEENSKNW